jgi:hypothetical protein
MKQNTNNRGGAPAARGSTAAPLAATVVVIACTLFLRWQSTARVPRPDDFSSAEDTRRGYLALVVAQPADCDAGTRYLGALNAPEIRAAAQVGALVIGSGTELGRAAEQLRDRFGELPVRRATRGHLATLRALGLRATPAVVVLDARGSVLLGVPAPVDAHGAERLRRVLTTLLSHDPQPAEETHATSD